MWWLFWRGYPLQNNSKRHTSLSVQRAMREYQVGIKHEKSTLENFAEKYTIEDFLRSHKKY